MINVKESWYLVKCRFKNYEAAIFNDLDHCREFADKMKTGYVEYPVKKLAIAHAGCKESKIKFRITKHQTQRICLCCEKPFKGKTKLCPVCNKKRGNISVGTIVTIKSMYPEKEVFSLLAASPDILYKISYGTDSKERAEYRKGKSSYVYSPQYLNTPYQKKDATIPDYILNLFKNRPDKELLYMEGDRLNPKLYYVCKRCSKEQCQTYESIRDNKGHNCDANKSSGEAVIEDFLLRKNIRYRVQHDTIACVNPKTRHILPYDFELPDHKLIIEVQGEQHNCFMPFFHGTEENYEYQVWKDSYKKSFAESKGYKVLYIYYSDISSMKYQNIIESILMEREMHCHKNCRKKDVKM